ncbi:MAG TPA: response regulator [Thermoguttaceae bacterium]|nr:response regulator [Thermoguttaceae bacterium]
MARSSKSYTILMADDDADDCLLVRDALKETRHDYHLRFVRDGEELSDYLFRRGRYADGKDAPRPDLILLDLKMPKKDGREVLKELKSHPRFRRIPIVALTTSTAEDDVGYSYDMGVNSYLTKPVTFRALVDMMDTLGKYWFELVELPPVD